MVSGKRSGFAIFKRHVHSGPITILPALRFQRDQINSLRNGRDSDLKQNENAFKDPEDGFGRKTVQGIDTQEILKYTRNWRPVWFSCS